MSDLFPGVDFTMRRPVIRYHGGKWNIAPWIISHFPKHRVYIEAYGGGASVLLRKKRSLVEIYNDLDGEIVNLFRLLRDPLKADVLSHQVRLTPYSREEFERAFEPTDGEIERARRLLVRAYFGFGSHSHNAENTNGFRGSGNKPYAREWLGIYKSIVEAGQRLQGVCFENVDALNLIHRHGELSDALFFLDPPYTPGSRNNNGKGYRHEMTDADHQILAQHLRETQAKVILCGYPNHLYDKILYPSWRRETCASYACGQSGRRESTEVLWMNFTPESKSA